MGMAGGIGEKPRIGGEGEGRRGGGRGGGGGGGGGNRRK